MIAFFMPMQPPTATHQQKQVRVINGKPIFYEPDTVKDARAKLVANLYAHKPTTPVEGPISLLVKWCFQGRGKADGSWRTSKPDTDNLNKLLKDCMTSLGFWKDDAQVAQEIIEKFWSDVPGIYIRIERLD